MKFAQHMFCYTLPFWLYIPGAFFVAICGLIAYNGRKLIFLFIAICDFSWQDREMLYV